MAEDNIGTAPKPDGDEGGSPATDWKAEARKWEARAKANKEKADAYDQAKEAGKTELQKAQDAAAKAEAELERLKADAAVSEARAKVAKATGVPAELIAGDDEESMTEFAKAVAAYAKPNPAPKAGKAGRFADKADADKDAGKRELARMLFGDGE